MTEIINSVVQPKGQEIYIDPYNGTLFNYNTHQSRVYLGRSINSLLKVFGDNCIIDGMDIIDVQYENDILYCALNPGKIIIDTTLIEISEKIELELNTAKYDTLAGYFIVSIGFKYLRDKFENNAKFKLLYVDTHGVCDDFFIDVDNIIITKIIIDKRYPENTYYFPTKFSNIQYLTINNKSYRIYPPDNITMNILKTITEIFFI